MLTEAQRELALTQLRLVDQIVLQLFRTRPDTVSYSREDARSDGALALAKAARDYDPARGASFRTFAGHRVTGAILDGFRRSDVVTRTERRALKRGDTTVAGGRRPIVVPSFLSIDAPGGDELADGPDSTDMVERAELALALRDLVDGLPWREAHAVRGVFLHDRDRADVAGELGVHPSRVSQLLRSAYGRLHEPVRELTGHV
jgi:RNA polymerase sigma factor FliA